MSHTPRPEISPLTAPFWDAARSHQLVVQRCDGCGTLRHYPQLRCAQCLGADYSWVSSSGRGAVFSYTVTHQAFDTGWADRVPYAVATIELEEGVRMVSDLPASDTDRVEIGAPVEVFFDDVDDELTLPRFRLTAKE